MFFISSLQIILALLGWSSWSLATPDSNPFADTHGNAELIHSPNPTPFNTSSPTLEELNRYNVFAAGVYCTEQLNDLSCRLCLNFNKDVIFHKVIQNRDLDEVSLITVHEKREEIELTFKGSSSGGYFLMDFTFAMTTVPGVPATFQLHYGFVKTVDSIWKKVEAEIVAQSKLHPTYKLAITGHSLGGAMASLAIFYLKYFKTLPNVPMTMVTFGAPRVGNKAFVDYMNGLQIPMARVVDRGDVVPHIPGVVQKTHELFLHTLREYYIDRKGEGRYCGTDKYEDPTCSNSQMSSGFDPIDHETYLGISYLECVGQAPAKET